MTNQTVSARPWWPGRTDEVRRVADRCLKRGWPDGDLTVGEIAAKTGSDVWIVDDALAMNDALTEVVEAFCGA